MKRLGNSDSRVATAFAAVALLGVAGVVWYLCGLIAPQPPWASERYFPMTRGAAFTYRVTNADGTITYRSRNISRQSASAAAPKLSLDLFSAMITGAHIDLKQTNAVTALAQLRLFDFAEINDIEYDIQGRTKSRVTMFALLDRTRLDQIGLNTFGIIPAVPFLPAASQTLTGTLGSKVRFQVVQEIEARGAQTTALGDFADCVRVHAEIVVNNGTTGSHTWYCAGIGQVADETTDTSGAQHSEVIAVSIGNLIRGSGPPVPGANQDARALHVFSQPLADKVVKSLEYQESTNSGGIATSLLPYNGSLLYGTASGALVALDRAAGRERWRFQTGDAIYGAPVVANGIAYFGSADKKTYAVRAQDGSFVWAFRMNDTASSSPFVSGNTVYVASEDRTLYALDADTGNPRWRATLSGPLIAQPIVQNGILYASDDGGKFMALDAATGTALWSHSAPEAIFAPATVADGIVYFGSFSHNVDATDRNLFALNAHDGHVIWDRELGSDILVPIVVAQGRTLVVTSHEIFALDAKSGVPLWRYPSSKPLKGAPLVMGNQIWVGRDGDLLALDAAQGTVLQTVPTTDATALTTGLASDGREIYVGFFDGLIQSYVGVTP